MKKYILNGFLIAAFSMAPLFQFAHAEEPLSDMQPVTAAGVNPLVLNDYILQPEDLVQVNVYEEPELTATVRVSAQGEINYPLLGTIKVTGYTVAKLREELTRLLEQDYLVNPQVQVYIQTYHNRTVSVTGSVSKPGAYPIPVGKGVTMMQVVAMAGGFTKAAAIHKVKIIRSENGKATTFEVNAKDIIKKGDKSKDVELQPNDVIFVPESWL